MSTLAHKVTEVSQRESCGRVVNSSTPDQALDVALTGSRSGGDEVPGRTSILVRSIRWYQRRVSPYLGPRCRFYPTCSSYGVSAIEQHGAIKGGILAIWRLMRCNQFSRGGIDDVPPKFRLSFRAFDKDVDR